MLEALPWLMAARPLAQLGVIIPNELCKCPKMNLVRGDVVCSCTPVTSSDRYEREKKKVAASLHYKVQLHRRAACVWHGEAQELQQMLRLPPGSCLHAAKRCYLAAHMPAITRQQTPLM